MKNNFLCAADPSSSSATPILFFTLRLQAHISKKSNCRKCAKRKTSEEVSNVPIYALHYTLTATKEGKNIFSPYKVIAQCMVCRVINCKCLTVIMHFCCLYDAIPFSFQAQVVNTEKFPVEPRTYTTLLQVVG